MDRIPNAWAGELRWRRKMVDEGADESILQWFRYLGIMEKSRIGKRVKDCLKKKGLNVEQTRKMEYDRSE